MFILSHDLKLDDGSIEGDYFILETSLELSGNNIEVLNPENGWENDFFHVIDYTDNSIKTIQMTDYNFSHLEKHSL